MSFLNPEYFWLFLFLVAAFIKNDFKNLRLRAYGYILTFILIVIALCRPIIEQEPIKSQEMLNDVVIGVDLSYSMKAEDIAPNRLEAAKKALQELVNANQKSRYGVVGFTTNAIILSPLTQDSELLLHLFGSLDEDFIITKGSSFMPAIKLARKLSSSKRLSLVLLTDGGDELNFEDEIAYAKEHHIIVNIFMLATPYGGTLKLKNGELLKDELGDIVVSRENSSIKALSDATGGIYAKDIDTIISALNAQRESEFKANVTVVQNRELFYYFVLGALIVFLVSVTTLKNYLLSFLLLFGVSLEAGVVDFAKNSNRLSFDRGVEYYQNGEYEKALDSFNMVKSSKEDVKSVLYYNIANTLVRLKKFKEARDAYLKSLILNYSQEADENLAYIKDVEEQMDMTSGEQKSKKKSSLAKKRDSSQKKKEGGSSNMKVSAAASSSGSDGKKTKSGSRFDLSSSKAKLSSKVYELINKRQVDEEKPW